MNKTFKTPLEIYYYCYEKGNVTSIPSNWYATKNFTWNEIFVNEDKNDGVPFYDVFIRLYNSALEFQKVRDYLGVAMNIHSWYRSVGHNVRVYIQSGYSEKDARKKTRLGCHLYGNAIDFHVTGLMDEAVRQKLLKGIEEGKFKVRIEANTVGWVHIDCGNPYINNGYNWGLFYI